MRFTILTYRRSVVMAGGGLLAALPLFALPLSDPYQPIRCLAAAAGAALIGFGSSHGWRAPGRLSASSAALLGGLLLWSFISAAGNGIYSSVFGVPMRFQGLTSALVLAAVALSAWFLDSRGVRFVVHAVGASAALQTVVMLGQLAAGGDASGTFHNSVPAGAWLAIAASMNLALALVSSGRDRAALLGMSALSLIGVGLSGSRGAWVAVVAGVAVALVVGPGKERRLKWWAAGSVAVLLILAAVSGSAVGWGKLGPGSLTSGSAATRYQIWRGTAEMISANLLTGVGPGRFIHEFGRYQPLQHALLEGQVRADQAHSLLLHQAAETGIVGALLWLSLSVLAILSGARAVRRGDAVALIALAGFSAYAVQGLFGVAAVEVDSLGWLLGGVLVGRSSVQRTDAGDDSYEAKPPAPSIVARVASLALAAVGAMAVAWYLYGDSAHTRALADFSRGEMASAQTNSEVATTRNPTVDVYRVALADAATYAGGSAIGSADTVVLEGIRREPGSFDLRLASARLARYGGLSPDVIAERYLEAVEAWPLSVEAGTEAVEALRAVGRDAEADTIASRMAPLVSGDGR